MILTYHVKIEVKNSSLSVNFFRKKKTSNLIVRGILGQKLKKEKAKFLKITE